MLDFADYHKIKKFLIQPNRFSGVIRKLSNGAYVSGAAIQSAFTTASSHVSGMTGISLLGFSSWINYFCSSCWWRILWFFKTNSNCVSVWAFGRSQPEQQFKF